MSLDALFAPRSIAVIGASTDPARIGGRPVDFLRRGGFAGPILPINPRAAEVQGLRAYPGIAAVGAPVDQAIIALPAEQALPAFVECAEAGVRAVVMFSAGFAEVGGAGVAQQAELVARARAANIRLLGPNSLGLMNVRAGVFSTFTSALDTAWPRPGGIAMASQSGAFASYCYALADARGLGFSHLVATGNEGDVDVAECLEWMAGDPACKVLVGYIEGCRDGARLVRALRAARAAGKPVVMMKVGATEAGAAAAASHTGSLAGSDAVFDAVFRAHGVHRARSIEELLDVAAAAAAGVLPRGRRLGVLTTSGGVGVMLADAAIAAGLDLPVVAPESQAEIKALIPFAEPRNPVDTTAQVVTDTSLIATVAEAMMSRTGFDIIIAFLAQAGLSRRHFDRLRAPLAALRARHPGLPFLAAIAALPEIRAELEQDGFLVFEDPDRAARAAAALVGLAEALAEPPSPAPAIPSLPPLPEGPLDEIRAAAALVAAGVPMAPGHLARDADEAVRHAAAIGYPVVLKVVSPDIPHKTEAGGVRLRLTDAVSVRAAHDAIRAAAAAHVPGARIEGVLVAPFLAGGVELILGARIDPVFGPVVMAGPGGILVELIADTAIRPAPVDLPTARAMLAETRAGRLLAGVRGAPAADAEAAARAIVALSAFAAAHAGGIESVEINPLRVTADGAAGLDALILRATG